MYRLLELVVTTIVDLQRLSSLSNLNKFFFCI
jgi:hypothetical protein